MTAIETRTIPALDPARYSAWRVRSRDERFRVFEPDRIAVYNYAQRPSARAQCRHGVRPLSAPGSRAPPLFACDMNVLVEVALM